MTIQLDASERRVLQQKLQEAFPAAHVDPSDVDAFALAVHRSRGNPDVFGALPPELRSLDLSRLDPQFSDLEAQHQTDGRVAPKATLTERTQGDRARYYWVEATHTRKHPHGYEPFVGRLAMARVSLPQQKPESIDTALGRFEMGDHLIATVHEANDKFANTLGYQLQRVDAITPLRQGLRFGAISVMLGYRDEHGPSCYILEAGTATGQAKVLFLGKTLDTKINAYTGYKPTPFTCSDNAYTGTLSLTGDSPAELHVTARKILDGVSQDPYMRLDVVFHEQLSTLRNIWPGLLIAEAALIVLGRSLSGIPDGCEKKALPE